MSKVSGAWTNSGRPWDELGRIESLKRMRLDVMRSRRAWEEATAKVAELAREMRAGAGYQWLPVSILVLLDKALIPLMTACQWKKQWGFNPCSTG